MKVQRFFTLNKDILYKWILAFGFYALMGQRFSFGIIGFLIGSLIDNYKGISTRNQGNTGRTQGAGSQYGRSQQRGPYGGQRFSTEDLFNMYQQRTNTNSDFATMLMALSAEVMKADGKVLKIELEYVKAFFKQQFGPQFSTHHLQTLKQFLDSDSIPLERICQDISSRTQEEVRVQLVHYLFGIAKADGHVSDVEIQTLQRIATLLRVPHVDFESVKNMFYRNINSDYSILGIESTATDDEIKKAYRKMAVRYHPDKVAQMGEEYQKGAKDKFQQIQEAYDNIKKQRNIK